VLLVTERRSTADFVIRALTISVSVLIVGTGLSLIVVEIFLPQNPNTGNAARGVGDIINTVVGALIGYLAGRAPGRSSPKDSDGGSDGH
jgi:hypothetical protein